MILLDCGNSSIKAQYHESGHLRASFASSYREQWARRLVRWASGLGAQRCWLASVLEATRQAELDRCLADRCGDAVTRFVAQARAGGVINGYTQPERLGVDRWLALIGAAGMVDGDCIVIDAGSAVTVDLLRADGQHLGGAILPGINTSLDRFRQIFSHIDFADPRIAETGAPGCSTEAAIQIDYAHDTLAGINEVVTRWIQRLDRNATLLLAGGDAYRVQRSLEIPGRIVPDLVFRGMLRLARQ
ncbi:MAG: type III pantothenate kinase [Gammaproteobacteria bacterium]|nr:type III pantothenate kinase [Gammaproteobacteria bacterium]MDH3537072.1 type III pantothenate kinase [Gammaproteobacteria bacterium]